MENTGNRHQKRKLSQLLKEDSTAARFPRFSDSLIAGFVKLGKDKRPLQNM